MENFLQLRVIELKKLIERQPSAGDECEFIVDGLFVNAKLCRNLTVRHALLLEQYGLFEITHGYGGSCHRYLGFYGFSSGITGNRRKVNEYVPENTAFQRFVPEK